MKLSHHGSGRVFLFLLLDLFHKNNLFASLSLSLTIVFVISGSLALLDYTLHKSAGVHVLFLFSSKKKEKEWVQKEVIIKNICDRCRNRLGFYCIQHNQGYYVEISARENCITFFNSGKVNSTWYPIFPPLKIICSNPSALLSITVWKNFFIPIGEQPPCT